MLGTLCGAQTSEGAARIAGPVDEHTRVVLHGNVSAAIQPQYDRGEAPGSNQLTSVRVVLARSAEQQASLDRFEQELQDKSSPAYHRWLTPEEFGRRYGPADSDIAAIVGWLQSHGLAVQPVSPGRTNIAFSGAVSQVEETFATSIHAYEIEGERFYSNTGDPTVPAALAPLVQGIAHLNTRNPRPTSIPAIAGRLDPVSRRLAPATTAARNGTTPNFTPPAGGNLYLVPGDAATIYDTPNPILNANYSSGPKYDGTGVSIGVVGTALLKTTTLQNYRSNFLGDTTAPVITNIGGVTFTGGSSEPYLDLEIAGGLAPGATLHYYLANDLNTPLDQALSDNTIDILVFAYDVCERIITTADNAAINKNWEQAAAQGIAVTVSSGDTGSAGCDGISTNGLTTAMASKGLGVNAYAATPFNVAVGGTDFDELNQNFATYSTTGGNAKTFYRTVLKYIPEATFDSSTQKDDTIAFNKPWGGLSVFPPNIYAGGGGPSTCSTNATSPGVVGRCTTGYSKPSWQRGAGVPADGVRDLPDVALISGIGFDNASWLVCDDTNDCTLQPGGGFAFSAFGGTSTAAPAFAGILALVQQSTGGRLGQAATQLYNLYNGSHAPQIFHDVTQGNNSVPCKQGSPNCSKDKAGYYFESGYNATAGYDLATGLGSVDATQLINLWATATSGIAATVTVTPTPTSLTTADSVTVAVTVAGAPNLLPPTGTVTLTGGGYTSPAGTLANSSFSFTIPANSLAAGTDTLQVSYSGDTNYASATGMATVTVTVFIPPAFTLSATSPAAIAAGAATTSTVTVQGSNGYTGAIALSCALTSSPAGAIDLPTCSATGPSVSLSTTVTTGTASIAVNTTAPTIVSLQPATDRTKWFRATGGSAVLALLIFLVPARGRRWRHMLGACLLIISIGFAAAGCGSTSGGTGAGGGTGGGSGGGGGTPTPAKTTPTVTVSPASSSIVRNMPVAVALTVAGSGATPPTGTIILASGGYTTPAVNLAGGAATVTIPASSLPAGANTLTASYPGDSSYNAATGTATLTVTIPPPVGGTTAGTYTFSVTGTGDDAAKTSSTTTFSIIVS